MRLTRPPSGRGETAVPPPPLDGASDPWFDLPMTESVDVIVVGAGLSGLSAGLHLQRQNKDVLILEKRSTPGGLCSTALVDGFEFAVGCNDFGGGFAKILRELEVDIEFVPSVSRICFEREVIHLPPDWRTLAKLLPHAGDLFRFGRRARKNGREWCLGPLVERTVKNPTAADLLNFLSIPIGVPPRECPLEVYAFDKTYGYDHAHPVRPVGGPQALSDALAAKFSEKGAIRYGSLVTGVERRDGAMLVHAGGVEYRAKHVVSTLEPPNPRPNGSKEGLCLGMLLVAAPKHVPYPEVHSITHCPPGVAAWFAELDDGKLPEKFSFNLVRSDLASNRDHHALTAYFLCPRGLEAFDEPTNITIKDYVLENVERMVPGVGRNASFTLLIDPAGYRCRFGLSSRLCLENPVPGGVAPENYDQSTGIYYAGRSVRPPGGHAAAAFLSGKEVARIIGAPS